MFTVQHGGKPLVPTVLPYAGNSSEVLWCTTRHLWSDLRTYF